MRPSCSCTFSCIGVAVRLGNTVETRTPCSTSSARRESARARRPNFEAAYADHSAPAESPAEELTKTTVPRASPQVREQLAGEHRRAR